MSLETLRQVITERVASFSTVEAIWPNHARKKNDATAWGRFSIQFGSTAAGSVGRNKFDRTPGLLYLQVFLPENTGTKTILQCESALAALVNDWKVREGDHVLTFQQVSIAGPPRTRDAGWYQQNLVIPFQADIYPAGTFPP